MALRRYLVEEVAEDFADRLLSRREALRRLGLLGIGMTAGSLMLAACSREGEGGDGAAGPAPTSSPTTGAPGAETITFPGPRGELLGAWSSPDEPSASVLVIHENQGLTPHFFDLVDRLADDGYAALSVDLLSAQGGTAAIADPAAVPAALADAPLDQLLGDLRAGIDELERRSPGVKVGVVGFCFGGAMAWNLLDTGEDRMAAVVPFYGPAPEGADFSGASAAVLGIYAELDERVNATRERARAALEEAGLTYEIRTFDGVDHAFFNDTGPRHDPAAAEQAYGELLAWFERHLTG